MSNDHCKKGGKLLDTPRAPAETTSIAHVNTSSSSPREDDGTAMTPHTGADTQTNVAHPIHCHFTSVNSQPLAGNAVAPPTTPELKPVWCSREFNDFDELPCCFLHVIRQTLFDHIHGPLPRVMLEKLEGIMHAEESFDYSSPARIRTHCWRLLAAIAYHPEVPAHWVLHTRLRLQEAVTAEDVGHTVPDPGRAIGTRRWNPCIIKTFAEIGWVLTPIKSHTPDASMYDVHCVHNNEYQGTLFDPRIDGDCLPDTIREWCRLTGEPVPQLDGEFTHQKCLTLASTTGMRVFNATQNHKRGTSRWLAGAPEHRRHVVTLLHGPYQDHAVLVSFRYPKMPGQNHLGLLCASASVLAKQRAAMSEKSGPYHVAAPEPGDAPVDPGTPRSDSCHRSVGSGPTGTCSEGDRSSDGGSSTASSSFRLLPRAPSTAGSSGAPPPKIPKRGHGPGPRLAAPVPVPIPIHNPWDMLTAEHVDEQGENSETLDAWVLDDDDATDMAHRLGKGSIRNHRDIVRMGMAVVRHRAALAPNETVICAYLPKLEQCAVCKVLKSLCFCRRHLRVPSNASACPSLAMMVSGQVRGNPIGYASSCQCPLDAACTPCIHEAGGDRVFCGLDLDETTCMQLAVNAIDHGEARCYIATPRLDCDRPQFQLERRVEASPAGTVIGHTHAGRVAWYFHHTGMVLRNTSNVRMTGCPFRPRPFLGWTAVEMHNGLEWQWLALDHVDLGEDWLRIGLGVAQQAAPLRVKQLPLDSMDLGPIEEIMLRGQQEANYATLTVLGHDITWEIGKRIVRPLDRTIFQRVMRVMMATKFEHATIENTQDRMLALASAEIVAAADRGDVVLQGHSALPNLAAALVNNAMRCTMASKASVRNANAMQNVDARHRANCRVVLDGKIQTRPWWQRLWHVVRPPTQDVEEPSGTAHALQRGPRRHLLDRLFGPNRNDVMSKLHLLTSALGKERFEPDRRRYVEFNPNRRIAGKGRPDWRRHRTAFNHPITTRVDPEQMIFCEDQREFLFSDRIAVEATVTKPAKGKGKAPHVCSAGCMRTAPDRRTWPKGICPTCRAYDGTWIPDDAFTRWYQQALDCGCTPYMPPGYWKTGRVYAPVLDANPKFKAIKEGTRSTLLDDVRVVDPAITSVLLAEAGSGDRRAATGNLAKGRLRSRAPQAGGIMFHVTPTVFGATDANLQKAIRFRPLAKPKGFEGTGKPEPGFWKIVQRIMTERADIAELIWPGFGAAQYQPLGSEWLDAFPGSRKREFLEEMRRPGHGSTPIKKVARFDAFVKRELALASSSDFARIYGLQEEIPSTQHAAFKPGLHLGLADGIGLTDDRPGILAGECTPEWDDRRLLDLERPVVNARLIANPTLESHIALGPHMRPILHLYKEACSYKHCLFYASVSPDKMQCWLNQFNPRYNDVVDVDEGADEAQYQMVDIEHSGKTFSTKAKTYGVEDVLPALPTYPHSKLIVMNDYSMMDNSYSEEAWHFIRWLYRSVGFPRRGRIARIWDLWCKPHIRVVLHNGEKHNVHPGAVNASGRDDTGLANALINGTLSVLGWLAALNKHEGGEPSMRGVLAMDEQLVAKFDSYFKIAIVGDDQMAVVPTFMRDQVAIVADIAARGGFQCKLTTTEDIRSAIFLAKRPVPIAVYRQGEWRHELRWTSVVGRMLYKSAWQRLPNNRSAAWMKGKAFMQLLLDGHMPIVRACFKATLSCLEGVSMSIPAEFKHKPVPLSRTATRPIEETWDTLADVYGISKADAVDCERMLMTRVTSLPGVFSHPAIDRFFAVDYDEC